MSLTPPPNTLHLPPQLYYWGAKSRAQGAMFIVAWCDKLAEVEWVKDAPWPGTPEWAAYETKSYMGQLPYLVDGDVKIGQSGAIASHLARKFGFGEDLSAADKALSGQAAAEAEDLFNMMVKAHYAPGSRQAAMDDFFAGAFPKHAAAIESALGESSIFGTAVSPGDVILAAYLDLAVEMQADCLDAFPKTKGLWEKVATNANVIKVKEGCFPYLKRSDDEPFTETFEAGVKSFFEELVAAQEDLGKDWSKEKNDAFCAKFYESDMFMIRPSGNPLTQEAMAEMWGTGKITGYKTSLTSVDTIKSLGDSSVALATTTTREAFSYDGNPNDDITKWTYVLTKASGSWKVQHGHRATGKAPE